MDKRELNRFLTTEPNNGYQDWLEQVWDNIPEHEISFPEYDANEKFFDDMAFWASKNSFPTPSFVAKVFIRRYKIFKDDPELKTWDDLVSKMAK